MCSMNTNYTVTFSEMIKFWKYKLMMIINASQNARIGQIKTYEDFEPFQIH